eukprot:SAG31_NODE_737_length_12474_cov_14.694303_8_plen_162_part_00
MQERQGVLNLDQARALEAFEPTMKAVTAHVRNSGLCHLSTVDLMWLPNQWFSKDVPDQAATPTLWQPLPNMQIPRYRPLVCTLDDGFAVVGGVPASDEGPSQTAEFFDPHRWLPDNKFVLSFVGEQQVLSATLNNAWSPWNPLPAPPFAMAAGSGASLTLI